MNKLRLTLFFMIAIAISMGIRMFHLVDPSLSIDEMVALRAVQNLNLENLFFDNHPPLYLLFLKLSCSIFGYDELGARMSSVLFSSAATGAIGWMLLRQNISLLWVGLGMLLHAVFPLSVEYAHETRPYAIFEFFCVVQFSIYLQYLKNEASRKVLLVVSLITALSSYLAAILFVFEGAFALKTNKRVLALVGINFLLLGLVVGAKEFIDLRSLDWQLAKYNLESLAFLPVEIFKSYFFKSVIAGVALVLLLISLFVSTSAEKLKKFYEPLLVAFSFLIFFIGLSVTTRRAIFLPRYFIFLTPVFFYFLLSALNFATEQLKKPKWPYITLIAAVMVGGVMSILNLLPLKHADWRGIAASAARYPNSIVLTAGNLAIATPYFDEINIHVVPVQDPLQVTRQVIDLLKVYSHVWVVDTYWNYLTYMPDQLKALKLLKYQISDFSNFEEGQETSVGVKISNPEGETQSPEKH